MTTRTDTTPPPLEDTLRQIALLAHTAADIECHRAGLEGPMSMRHSLGLAIRLVGCEFTNLIPPDLPLPPDPDPAYPPTREPLAHLEHAVHLAQTIPDLVERPGATAAIAHLIDALRETTQYDQANQ